MIFQMTQPSQWIVQVDRDLEELIPGYIQNRQKDIERLQMAIEQHDYESIRFIGHGMKGSGSGYGFDQITEIGRLLELSGKEENREQAAVYKKQLAEYLEGIVIQYE